MAAYEVQAALVLAVRWLPALMAHCEAVLASLVAIAAAVKGSFFF
jgi:hypothetical protein